MFSLKYVQLLYIVVFCSICISFKLKLYKNLSYIFEIPVSNMYLLSHLKVNVLEFSTYYEERNCT